MQREPDTAQRDVTGDYGYDLAHEGHLAARSATAGTEPASPIYVSTQSADTAEDYTYDLAHDVPPQQ